MLSVFSLSFDYLEKPAFSKVSFTVPDGKLLHIEGRNGAGKTTLLRTLAGILRPTSGEIYWDNQAIAPQLSTYQQSLCYVSHKPGIHAQFSVKENCYFDMHWQRRTCSLDTLLDQFQLSALADTPCHQLSMGQRRRVSLLRLFMSDARLWLLDEPFVGLDKASMACFIAYFNTHLEQGGSIVITSHQSLSVNDAAYEVYSL